MPAPDELAVGSGWILKSVERYNLILILRGFSHTFKKL